MGEFMSETGLRRKLRLLLVEIVAEGEPEETLCSL